METIIKEENLSTAFAILKADQKENVTNYLLYFDLLKKSNPWNESEKPYIRKTIEDMKSLYNVRGKTAQVAEKGLDCVENIYSAVQEAHDGYIFFKSMHGRGLDEVEKQ